MSVYIGDWLPNLRRRMVWDIVPDEKVREWSKGLGLFPSSEEVDEAEMKAAFIRLSRLNCMSAPLSVMTHLAGEVIANSIYQDHETTPSDEDVERITVIVQAGVHAILAELLDMEILHVGDTPEVGISE